MLDMNNVGGILEEERNTKKFWRSRLSTQHSHHTFHTIFSMLDIFPHSLLVSTPSPPPIFSFQTLRGNESTVHGGQQCIQGLLSSSYLCTSSELLREGIEQVEVYRAVKFDIIRETRSWEARGWQDLNELCNLKMTGYQLSQV